MVFSFCWLFKPWLIFGVKSSQNVMLFAEIDEGKDVIGQREEPVVTVFYLITSE